MFRSNAYADQIAHSLEYKALDRYFINKNNDHAQTLLDRQKVLLANWLLGKLAEVKTWNHPLLPTILITADEINQSIEREKSRNTLYHVSNQKPDYMASFKSNFLARLEKRLKEEGEITEVPNRLEVYKTGIITRSDLSKRIVKLYDKMQQKKQVAEVRIKENTQTCNPPQP